jgi:hypothetical protein
VGRPIHLELLLDGYLPWALDLTVAQGEPTPVMAELTREPGASRPPGGRR